LDSTIWCWGDNGSGELGDGTTLPRTTPVRINSPLGNTVVQLAAGSAHTCARKADGSLWCWGDNSEGTIGDGTMINRPTPVPVPSLGIGIVAESSMGTSHSCVRKNDGTAWCWGNNHAGQLGDGTTINRTSPVAVVGLGANVVRIAAGGDHTCAVLSDQTVWCWGANDSGELGDGTTTDRTTPVKVLTLASIVEVSAGIAHTCARKSTGGVFCWGMNFDGELGDGTTTERHTPVSVVGMTNAAEISLGGSFSIFDPTGGGFSCARRVDHTAWCWGRNTLGQLGDGTTVSRVTPVRVSIVGPDIAEITAGDLHACVRKEDGTIMCWGFNGARELGDGTTTNRLAPVPVIFPLGLIVQVPVNCIAQGCVFNSFTGQWEYILADANDPLRVLFFGVQNHVPAGSRDCNGAVRVALVKQYPTLFGIPPGGGLTHVWRQADAASTVFVAAVGVPPGFALQPGYVPVPGQQSNPFCNAGPVDATFPSVTGIHLGFDDSETPPTGPNWNTKIGDSDFADLDPLRFACNPADQVCEGLTGTNGLVQVVAPTGINPVVDFPTDDCDMGSIDLVFDGAPYTGYFGRCGDGTPALVGGCVIGYKDCGASPCAVPGGPPLTSGRSYMCLQPSGVGSCYVLAPGGGTECRGANRWMRKVTGQLVNGPPGPELGAHFRIRMTTTGGCRQSVASNQISCLETADPPSIGP
jgi:alpha-tubulin suppressor-like RCC1 family protein